METAALVLTRTVATLEAYGKAVAELYKRKLLDRDKRASGRLAASVVSVVTSLPDGRGYEVSLSLEDYWKYVEHGRRPGKWPPRDAILNWIRIKPVVPYPDKNGRLPSEKSLAFLISRKIGTDGIKPSPVLAETLEELNAVWLPKIEEAFGADVEAWADAAITLTPGTP